MAATVKVTRNGARPKGGLCVLLPAIGYYPDGASGASRMVFDEAQYLTQQGHTVWLVAPNVAGTRPEYSVEDGLHLLLYRRPRLAAFDPRRSFVHQHRTRAILRRYLGTAVDVIHGHAPLQFAGALAAGGASARRCYSVHSLVRLEMLAAGRTVAWLDKLRLTVTAHLTHRVEQQLLRQTEVVTADSQYTRELLGRHHGHALRAKTHVIPGWVDLNRFNVLADRQAAKRRLGWPTQRPVLFTLRRLVPRMGLDRLLRAARLMRSAGYDFHLVIGGSGPEREALLALRGALGLEATVHFAGHVSEETLPLMYGAADAFVLPTTALECFGLIALEALACGTPVLATPVGAIPEIVAKAEPRWLAADASAEALARLLRAFLDGHLPAPAPAALRQVVCQDYAMDQVLRQLTTLALAGAP